MTADKNLAPGGTSTPADEPSPPDLEAQDTPEAGAETCTCPPGFHQRGCPEAYWPPEEDNAA